MQKHTGLKSRLSLKTETVRTLADKGLEGVGGGMKPLTFGTACYTANCMTLGTFCPTHDCTLTFGPCGTNPSITICL